MITMFRIDIKKNKDQKINEPTVMSSAKSSARITQPIPRRRCSRRPCKKIWNKLFEKSEWSSDCDNRENVSCSSLGFWAWPLAIPEISSCRYAELIRLCIPYNQVASLDVVPDCMPRPPALTKIGKGGFTSMQMSHTHPHTLRSFKFTFKSTKQCSVSQLLVFTHASLSVTIQRLTASVEFLVPLEPNHSLAVQ